MSNLLITTTSGPILGFSDTFPLRDRSSFSEPCRGTGGLQSPVNKWLGIPYGQAQRWKRPAPPQAWSEPLLCTEFGPSFPQASDLIDFIYAGKAGYFLRTSGVQDEQTAFNLNIFGPSDLKAEDDLPVMVWIHGGSLASGFSSALMYDPTEWIRSQERANRKFLVVTGNYRVNLFGFMASRDLAEEDEAGLAGNYGAYDCIAMLEWVQANIKSFGGNPDNVTIFGESAGAFLVGALLATQKKLFKRAIMQSGFPESMTHREVDSDVGNGIYEDLLEAFSVPAGLSGAQRLDRLREIPQKSLVDFLVNRGTIINEYGLTIEPVSCASSLWPKPAIEIIKDRRWNPHLETVLLGHTRDEGSLFASLFNTSTSTGYEWVLNQLCPWTPRKTIDGFYPMQEDCIGSGQKKLDDHTADFESPSIDWKNCPASHLISDQIFEGPLESLASVFENLTNIETNNPCKVYTYRVDATIPSIDKILGLGAFHTVEIPFIFNLKMMWKPGSPQEKLAEKMGQCWSEFARTGFPAPTWPQYLPSTSSRAYVFGETGDCSVEDLTRTRSDLERQKLAFWINNSPQMVTSRKPHDILV